MKKVLCLLTAAALLLTLCACGAEEAPSEETGRVSFSPSRARIQS